jgi:arylsulfatase A-like enzyme
MSSRRTFLKQAGTGAAALAWTRCAPETREGGRPREALGVRHRPNVLLITTDYQSALDVPAIGHRFLRMPTLDRLCAEGAVFRRHYSTAPICIPARNTWITGQYPHTHGKWENIGGWVPEGSPVLMQELAGHGYQTTAVGKLHLGFPDETPLGGFHRWVSADRKGNYGSANQQDDYATFLAERGLVRDDYLRRGVEAAVPHVYDWPWDESWHIDAWVGERALEIVERGELQAPWFLWLSFNGPHNPWDPPARCSAPYKDMDLPLGHTFPGELQTKPTDHTRLRYNYTGEIARLIDADPMRRDQIIHAIRAGHYGNLTFIDEQIGRVIDALERRGELDDTVVLWTSDHGSHLGDHDLIHKGTHYDASARVPFVVRYPGRVEPGERSGLTGHVDLMPTILSLVGAQPPDTIEGRDLTPVLEGVPSMQEEVFIEIRGNVSIVTDRWKMGLYPHDGDGDLYDLEDDPFELINRFDDDDYARVREELTERIRAFSPEWPPAFSVVDG